MSRHATQKNPEKNQPDESSTPKSSLSAALEMANNSADSETAKTPPKNTTSVEIKPRAIVPIGPSRCRQAGYLHNTWDVIPEKGVTYSDLFNPDIFKHIAQQFRPFDKLIVIREDSAYYAELLVTSCDRTWAVVREITFLDLTVGTAARENEFEEYKFEHRTLGKWTIIKKGNEGMEPLKDGFETRVEAVVWLDEYLRNKKIG